MQLQFLSQSVLIRPTSDRHLQNKITWIKTKKKKKIRNDNLLAIPSLSRNICFSREDEPKAWKSIHRNTKYRILFNSVIDGNVGGRQHFFFPPPSLPFPRRLCAIHREGRRERKISPRDRSIANRCLSIQIQYLPHTRTRSPFLSQPPYLVVSRRQRGYFGDKGG